MLPHAPDFRVTPTAGARQPSSIWAVVNFPLQSDYPNGFSQRWARLLTTVASQHQLDIVGLHWDGGPDPEWTADTFLSPDIRVHHAWFETLGRHPLFRGGRKARLGWIQHLLFGPQSMGEYPRRFPNLKAHLAQHPPKLAIFYLNLAHLSYELPAGIPCIYVLEEHPPSLLSGAAPNTKLASWTQNWIERKEQAAFEASLAQMAARKAPVIAISDEEKERLSQYMPADHIIVIPHSVDCIHFRPADQVGNQDIDIAMFGVLRHARNYVPALELYSYFKAHAGIIQSSPIWAFVGTGAPASIRSLESPTVHVTGFVPDTRPYYARSKVVVVPATTGTGVKTTVLQAWAMGRPVVATPYALKGLPFRPNENVLVGETVEELAGHIATLLANPLLRDRIGGAGRETACRERNASVAADRFAELCSQILDAEPSSKSLSTTS